MVPEKPTPQSCKPEPTGRRPAINRTRCEAKEDCVAVCPYGVFDVRVLGADERVGLSLRGRLNVLVHRGRQAVVAKPESCHACGLCVEACPEGAITLVKTS